MSVPEPHFLGPLVPSVLIKTRHGESPGKLLHPLPEVRQPLCCFWVTEQEGFEIL